MTVSETYKLEQELETRKDLMFKMSEKILTQQEIIQKVREWFGQNGLNAELSKILKEKP